MKVDVTVFFSTPIVIKTKGKTPSTTMFPYLLNDILLIFKSLRGKSSTYSFIGKLLYVEA